ncbi:MAG TPA: sigma 54-interacting transcriptional regulator, partial [bacterium]|nr:sigma 54-interacting transcriptional regulator [bacterium]
LFEEADGGTIFLDEITNTTLSFQSRLLRVLQEQEIRRVGDTIPRKIDVRVVAATNKDVRQLITDGQFREDLFFRISVIPVFLAPLRERREDIPLLIKYFVEKYTQPGRMMEGLFGDALQILTDHDWPGNIRELENTVQRLMIFSGKSKLGPSDVRKAMQPSAAPLKSLEDFEKNLFESERKYFERVLDHVGGNKSKAAEWLGIKRTTLNDRLKKLGIS